MDLIRAGRTFLQGGTHYLHAKWPDFIMINAGQDGNIGVA